MRYRRPAAAAKTKIPTRARAIVELPPAPTPSSAQAKFVLQSVEADRDDGHLSARPVAPLASR